MAGLAPSAAPWSDDAERGGALTLLIVAGVFMGFCALAEVASRRLSLSPELVRKLAHMSSGVFAALLPLVLSFGQIAGLGLGFALLMAVSLRLGIFTGIHGVSRATYGELYFPLGLAALAVISSRPVPFAYGALVLGLGDGLAALAGERLGRRTVPIIATKKTLWGSGTFLTTCFAVGAALTASTGLPLTHAAAVAATTAVALTPVELLLTRGLDNLALPILAGLLLASL